MLLSVFVALAAKITLLLLLSVCSEALSDCSLLASSDFLEDCRECVEVNKADPLGCLAFDYCYWANHECNYDQEYNAMEEERRRRRTRQPTAPTTRRPSRPTKSPTSKPTKRPSKYPTSRPTKPTREPTQYPSSTAASPTLPNIPGSGEDEDLEVKSRRNILLIIADDLRQTRIAPEAATPNMQRLRAQSINFDSAHCNVPLCGPSRASFLNGKEPLESGVYGNKMVANRLGQHTKTLPEFLKANGYVTESFGKVIHHAALNDPSSFSSQSWSAIPVPKLSRQDTGYMMLNCQPGDINKSGTDKKNWQRFTYGPNYRAEAFARPYQCSMGGPILQQFDDMYIASKAVESLQRLRTQNAPFFFAVGFYRPHLPHAVHADIWDLFENDLSRNDSGKFTVTAPQHTTGPEPEWSMPSRFAIIPDERESGSGGGLVIPNVYQYPLLPNAFIQSMRVGYAAAMAQMDVALGLLLDGLRDNGFESNTLVIMVGDNGFNLGESSLWYKQLLTDHSVRVPMLVRMPQFKVNANNAAGLVLQNEAFVELLDLYRTAADFAGLGNKVEEGVAGKSLLPLLMDPFDQALLNERDEAISIIHRCDDRQCADWMFRNIGFSIRTKTWRYNVWMRADGTVPAPLGWTADMIAGEELYNHASEGDEDHFNLAPNEETAQIKLDLFERIKARYSRFTNLYYDMDSAHNATTTTPS